MQLTTETHPFCKSLIYYIFIVELAMYFITRTIKIWVTMWTSLIWKIYRVTRVECVLKNRQIRFIKEIPPLYENLLLGMTIKLIHGMVEQERTNSMRKLVLFCEIGNT